MADLPLILIGPILRRVEPRSVSVFVATCRAAAIHLALFDGIVDGANPPAEHAGADAQTTAFTARFHATVVTASITDAAVLQPGHRYSYDLRITPAGEPAKSLKDLGLLADRTVPGYGTADPDKQKVEINGLGYADGQLPSFVTCPANLSDLVLAHCSCRKPHGDGEPAQQYVDAVIDDLHGADAGRPHMLFLTGDQIYADDVSAALLPGINSLGITLVSADAAGVEQVPSPAQGGPFNVSTTVLPPGFRQRPLSLAGFTSEAASCHLISFGEWLAMYCIAWNPDVWPVLAVSDSSDPSVPAAIKAQLQNDTAHAPAEAPSVLGRPSPEAAGDIITPLYGAPAENQAAFAVELHRFLDSKPLLDAFRREVPKIRRLLANVPTYMICDDHEVSDDWFMTGGIRAKTTGNTFGRAVLRNALAAYTVCQAWGNDPQLWATDADHKALLAGIAGLFGPGWTGGLPVGAQANVVDQILGLSPAAQPKFDFSYTVDGPVHRVRVLDTRTHRLYSTPYASPGLLTQNAMDHQLPVETLPDGHVLIVVSPAPVFGPAVMTELGGVLAANEYDVASFARSTTARAQEQAVTGLTDGRPLGSQFYDAEHWGAHPAAFERLLERLSHNRRIVVLGGDVHYGAAFAMDWTGSGRTSRIVHFTSSAARNAWIGTVRNLMLLNGMSVGLQRIGMPMTRLGWTATLPAVVDDLSAEPPLARVRIRTGPVLLSDELFRKTHPLTRAPDWVWRADPVVDTRLPAGRPPAARMVGLATDLPAVSAAVHQYGDVAAAHSQGLDTVAIARGLQFLNNAGVIRFNQGADGLRVSQSLYSLRARPQPNEKGADYIVHETLLEPAPVSVPTTVGQGG
jgi:hypothetical protein